MQKNILHITVFSFTLLAAVLNIFIVLYNFYDVSDTLIAGIISFFGAIIGGSITLLGVNRTIQNSRREEEMNRIISNIEILNNASKFLIEMHDKSIFASENNIDLDVTLNGFNEDFTHYGNGAFLRIIDKEVHKHYMDVTTFVLSKKFLFDLSGKLDMNPEKFYSTLQIECMACVQTIENQIEQLIEKYEYL